MKFSQDSYYAPSNTNYPVSNSFIFPEPLTPRKVQKRVWTKSQVEHLYETVKHYSTISCKPIQSLTLEDFTIISVYYNCSPIKCMKKVREISVTGSLAPGAWSLSEDELLNHLLTLNLKKWGMVADKLNKEIHNNLKIRSGKQCKERWINHLDPNMKKDKWTPSEDLEALKLYKALGKKWCEISRVLGNRTDSSIKNRVKSLMNKQKQDLNFNSNSESVVDFLIRKLSGSLLE